MQKVDTVLLFGASGMVGRNLADYAPKHIQLLTPTSKEVNLFDFEQTKGYIKKHEPSLIIHSAGIVGGIQANIANPVKFLIQNTDIGRNLIWAAFESGVKKLLNLGSSCMYPKDATNPLKEEYVLTGELEPTNEGYALAKIFSQRLCAYINRENNEFKYKTVIPCNLYGKYDKFSPDKSHMIPAVIRKIHEAKTSNSSSVEIWGDGNARREFMYAGDLAQMIWECVQNFEKIPDILNLGLGHDSTINEYYKTIAKVIDYKGQFSHDLTKPVGMKQKLVDITKQNTLRLMPNHTLEEGIKMTYDFFLTQSTKK
ncbi:MAG: GDP-fucose synthetase [Bacteroidetes bacterium HGW-Bacteroidetes-12]|nr:MAG: GDP-fucose synthetase [Bacteroidetes bacterium HGW-Bacteroidetes-12]